MRIFCISSAKIILGDKMLISIIRTLLIYVVIILAVRLMGKRQIGELQTSELVVTLMISDIAAIPMQNTSQPLLSGIIPIFILIICEIFLSIFMLKNFKFRRFICGSPQIVINDGKVDQKKMKELRMSTEDLFEQLRQLEVFNLTDVKYAIVETNGKMSILKKAMDDMPTRSDLNLQVEDKGFEIVIISDGDYFDTSMQFVGVSREWTDKILKKEKMKLKDVFIMTCNDAHEYNIVKKSGDKN